jgi:uncharacterized protein
MHPIRTFSSDVAFTPAVKAVQSRKGSRSAYARMEEDGGWETTITGELKEFIEAQTSVFLGTASAQRQPYIQHRGGPAGFLRVLDEHTIGLVDFVGNRQFISTGNLIENPKFHLFLMDYARRRRVKVWGTARVVEGDAELVARLMPVGYRARAEQAIVLTVTAWDVNCPQHIPLLLPASQVQRALAEKDLTIATLEAEVARLRLIAVQAGT